jgi:inosose dehydratase
MARFLPLGWGTVDFKGVLKSLRKHGYDGVLCVELDKQPVCNYHSAMVSRRYLHDALGF